MFGHWSGEERKSQVHSTSIEKVTGISKILPSQVQQIKVGYIGTPYLHLQPKKAPCQICIRVDK